MKSTIITRAIFVLSLAAMPVFAVTDSATSTLGVNVSAEATITVNSSPTLSKGGTEFESYTGNTTFTYKVRTTDAEGSGSVTALVTTEFEVGSAITTADLSHVVSGAGVGTKNSDPTVASASSATNIMTFGTNAHSGDSGDSATIAWTLADRPTYKTGSYSTVVTLTITSL